jgi:histidine triad (HIT) family protein
MTCLFCRIIDKAEPAYVVDETPDTVSFLDTRPVFKGHVLIVPRPHLVTLVDLPPHLTEPLFTAVQRTAQAMTTALQADGSFVAVNNTVSQSVPHLHVHVVPRRRKDGLRGFFWPRTTYADHGEASEYADRLRSSLVGDQGDIASST